MIPREQRPAFPAFQQAGFKHFQSEDQTTSLVLSQDIEDAFKEKTEKACTDGHLKLIKSRTEGHMFRYIYSTCSTGK